MNSSRRVTTAIAVLVLSVPAFAHVRSTPRESALGATETYTFRVPSERGLTTTAVVVDVPEGVTIVSVSAPEGAAHAETMLNGRIVHITWTIQIAAGAVANLEVVAKNPTRGESIIWKAHQKYSDGSVSDWVGAEGTPNPAPFTTLIAPDKK
ncbi:MAG: DUF1775 domain-containing protein [Acidobacteriota bacterium]